MKLFKKQQCNTTYSGIISAESEKVSAMAPLPPEDCQEPYVCSNATNANSRED